ncbi:MAG: hypothetical protein P4L22_02170 [Candidatus Babeliales bacterium]|nr:hypothetical protein [Candidatus Babeliales bacterium]
MKNLKYILSLAIALNSINFNAAEINQIELEFSDNHTENKINEYNSPYLYRLLGEDINEFNKGEIDQQYIIINMAIKKIKNLINLDHINIQDTYPIIDEFVVIIEQLIETDQLNKKQSDELDKSMSELQNIVQKKA